MTKATLAAYSILAVFTLSARAEEEPKVEASPLKIGALQEFGFIQNGIYKAGTENAVSAKADWVDHFGAFLTKDVTIDDRLHLSAGLGGVFQFRKPETVGSGFPFHQRKSFFVGPTKAEAVFDIGEIGSPWLQIGSGMFGYKYNPQAYNLGEYLFRSGGYPTYSYTGGYVIANSAGAGLEGFKALFKVGNLKADLLLFTETNLAPLYDWSLASVASYNIGDGLLDIGAGVNFQRLLQVRPSRTASNAIANSYFEQGGQKYSGSLEFYANPARFYNSKADKLSVQDSAANAGEIVRLRNVAASYQAKADIVDAVLALEDSAKPELTPYSASAILLMARATFDPKKLFGGDIFGAEDLKLYSEVDVLGLVNKPIFYEKVEERMPLMFGFNFPGFKFFDLIALQGEYMKSPWLNNTYQRGRNRANIPYFPGSSDPLLSETEWNDQATKDDFKWTLQVKKSVGQNVSLWFQAANDHLRMPSSIYFYGPQFDHNEVTAGKDHWYWMTQISWGL